MLREQVMGAIKNKDYYELVNKGLRVVLRESPMPENLAYLTVF